MNQGGRPRIEIDFNMLEKYCAIMCTAEECADLFDCSPDTLDRRIKERFGYGFAEYYKKASAKGKASLRRKQYEVAMSGNTSMLIWLGKNCLGQSDKTSFIDDRRETYQEPETLKLYEPEEKPKTD